MWLLALGPSNIGSSIQGYHGGCYIQCQLCGGVYLSGYGHVCPGKPYLTATLTPKETTPMTTATGKKPIVLQRARVEGEFDTQDAAIQEASRLAGKDDDEYVVYVPVAIVRPKKDVTVDLIPAAS